MLLQLALDLLTIDQALAIIQETRAFIDIFEIGTPMIVQDGMRAVQSIRRACPDATLLADVKIMDGGKPEAQYAFQAGADIVTVLAAAEDATIRNVVAVAGDFGKKVMVDMIAISDVATRALAIEKMGVDYICVHTASDVQNTGRNPLGDLMLLRQILKKSELAVAGGIKMTTLPEIVRQDPAIVIVGSAITGQSDRPAMAAAMKQTISSFRGGDCQ